jgi:hypothetical protein
MHHHGERRRFGSGELHVSHSHPAQRDGYHRGLWGGGQQTRRHHLRRYARAICSLPMPRLLSHADAAGSWAVAEPMTWQLSAMAGGWRRGRGGAGNEEIL